VIISLPNVAAWPIRLGLLGGRFEYTASGILDRTHLRFFTLASAVRLVEQAGLQLMRVDQNPMLTRAAKDAILSALPATTARALDRDPTAPPARCPTKRIWRSSVRLKTWPRAVLASSSRSTRCLRASLLAPQAEAHHRHADHGRGRVGRERCCTRSRRRRRTRSFCASTARRATNTRDRASLGRACFARRRAATALRWDLDVRGGPSIRRIDLPRLHDHLPARKHSTAAPLAREECRRGELRRASRSRPN
jgi:hypothetical protein